ncbi:MAG: type II toxin-antitoxin system VapC family toxin [Aeromicrobium sp.]|uniref:type II toxin-antitoxin system VapC family toxin n=1 Tax=Aeromicrobium sp. TaxID=1871063 RepID=UPI0039E443E6
MTSYYLDTSVAIHAFTRNPRAVEWFNEATADPTASVLSSRLLRTEMTRYLRREGIEVARRAEILDYVAFLAITDSVLATAEAITEHVRTLDAIHIASALATGAEVMVSHDTRLLEVAEFLGFDVLDPVAG